MVRELTELQGAVGQYYASSDEPQEVATAIEAHYHPRFLGDSVAATPTGIVLALADKLDTIVAVFSQKDARYPTGSKDPMGLRRMAFGILHTILENKLAINLDTALQTAYQTLGPLAKETEAATLERTRPFLLQRFKGYLLDQDYAYDTIDAVLESDISPWADLNQTIERLNALKKLQQDTHKLKAIYEPANRTAKILGNKYNPAAEINPALFEHETEKALFEAISAHEPFEALTPKVDAFFDKVLVNAEDSKVKENRYALLSLLNKQYRQFADFTQLVVS
jgi:glycyl-tRNA synthetase beta chain